MPNFAAVFSNSVCLFRLLFEYTRHRYFMSCDLRSTEDTNTPESRPNAVPEKILPWEVGSGFLPDPAWAKGGRSQHTSMRMCRAPLDELFLGNDHPAADAQRREVRLMRLIHQLIPAGWRHTQHPCHSFNVGKKPQLRMVRVQGFLQFVFSFKQSKGIGGGTDTLPLVLCRRFC